MKTTHRRSASFLVNTFYISLTLCCMSSSMMALDKEKSTGDQPNIVFIFIDDMGYGDLSCTGNKQVQTSNIDQLAAEGIRFTNFYVNSPICSPSRVAITTGQYPAKHGIHSYLASRKRNSDRGMKDFLNPKAPAIARAFKSVGYATAHFGKWHMGGGRDVDDAPHPQAYGFDESLVSFEGLGDRILPPGGLSDQSEKLKQGNIERVPKHRQTEIYVDRSIDFIKRNRQQPFYLHLWLNDVHDGHNPSEEQLKKYAGSSGNPYEEKFFAVLDAMDKNIGRLIKSIDDHGLAENTMIVLTSDNGPTAWSRYDRDGFDAPGSTGGDRGRKWSLYEGGIRMPLIVRWKGKIPAGRVDDQSVIAAFDFFPTFCKLAGIDAGDVKFDGKDMSPAFLGKPVKERGKPIFWDFGRNKTQYLQPHRKWDQSPNLAVRDDRWKLMMNADGSRVELYDMSAPQDEQRNVAGHHPEVTNKYISMVNDWVKMLPNYESTVTAGKSGEVQSVEIKQGQTLENDKAPNVEMSEVTVQATVSGDTSNGVIVARGGQAAGVSLFVKKGIPHWTVRVRSKAVTIASKEKMLQGKVSLEGHLSAKGEMTLRMNGKVLGNAKSPLINVEPLDPLNCGFDDKGNVGDYKGDFKFTGNVVSARFAVQKASGETPNNGLVTRWAYDLDTNNVLPEYPRPQLKRSAWKNLNGYWQYAIRPVKEEEPKKWDGRILVPFAAESLLSDVQKQVGKDNHLWYRTTFQIPAEKVWQEKRIKLNFGAVDWRTTVYINGKEVGKHEGGYDPFSFDITDALNKPSDKEPTPTNEIIVKVWDPTEAGHQPRGKQLTNPRGIWYTPVTGIWQTVWLEPVDATHITGVNVITDLERNQVRFEIDVKRADTSEISVSVNYGPTVYAREQGVNTGKFVASYTIPGLSSSGPWTPEKPNLHEFSVTVSDGPMKKVLFLSSPKPNPRLFDSVGSYYALRTVELRKDDHGIDRIFLNGKPYFQYGPLDQGWWPDGLYTAPTDDALKYDIEMTKRLGFNMIRKHVKVEPARWYYWADKLGVLVWQDMPSGMQRGGKVSYHVKRGQKFDADLPPEARENFRRELKSMIDSLKPFGCIVAWIPFNEGWGQHDTNEILEWAKKYDPSRLVGGPSGWEDRGYGDFIDVHVYPGPDMHPAADWRASVLGEFGGLGLPMTGHTWVNTNNWGYRTYKTKAELKDAYEALIKQFPVLINKKGLAAAVYTQTTDVEVEVNGLMTYDREILKLDEKWIKKLHEDYIHNVKK